MKKFANLLLIFFCKPHQKHLISSNTKTRKNISKTFDRKILSSLKNFRNFSKISPKHFGNFQLKSNWKNFPKNFPDFSIFRIFFKLEIIFRSKVFEMFLWVFVFEEMRCFWWGLQKKSVKNSQFFSSKKISKVWAFFENRKIRKFSENRKSII